LPFTLKLADVPVEVRVRMIGDPAKTEQESPTLTAAAQFVFDDPGPTPSKLKTRFGCAANVKKLFSPTLAAVRGELISTPSVVTSGPPVKARVVPTATSASQGGPGGVDDGSALNVELVMVTVIMPPDPISKFPMTLAEAAVTRNKTATTPRMIIEFEIRYIVLLRQVNSAHLLMFWY
jgi:hypothetical protein